MKDYKNNIIVMQWIDENTQRKPNLNSQIILMEKINCNGNSQLFSLAFVTKEGTFC